MADIPRKLHIDEAMQDPELAAIAHKLSVEVDGVKQDGCVAYNIDEGWIDRYKKVDNKLVVVLGDLVVERIHSTNIKIDWRNDA